MGNEYRRLLKKQFGKKNYAAFVRSVKAEKNATSIIPKDVYLDIYHKMKTLQPVTLVGKHRQLEEVISRVIRIGRMFYLAVGVYLAAVLILLVFGSVPMTTFAGVVLLTLAFALKTGEYLGNRFCYVDVRIIITYKTVLECLISEKTEG